MLDTISNQYALAIFDIAKEESNIDKTYELIELVDEYISNGDYNKLLNHPKISKSEKKNLLNELFGKLVSENVINFLYVLIDNNRIDSFSNIVEEYKILKNLFNNIMEIKAYSASKLTKEKIESLEATLSKKYDSKISIINIVDKSIIGGVRLEFQGNVIDNSLKAKLEDLKLSLKG